jgi:hypothetical protein
MESGFHEHLASANYFWFTAYFTLTLRRIHKAWNLASTKLLAYIFFYIDSRSDFVRFKFCIRSHDDGI